MDGKDITVSKYYKILEILREEAEPIQINVDLIDCVFGVDSANVPLPKFNYYMNELDFLKTPYEPKIPKKSIKVGEKEFVPTLDVSKVTTAQYVDFQAFAKKEDHKNMLNVLFISKGKEYGEEDNSELLGNNLSLEDYSDVLFFFLHLLNKLTEDTLHSSLKQMKKMYRKEKDPQKKEELMNQMVQMKLALSQINDNGLLESL